MSENTYTVASSQGWFGRIGGAFKGLLFGLVLIAVSFPVLFLNEGRAVKTRKTLDEGEKNVVAVSVDSANPAHEGKLVYATGDVRVGGVLEDAEFQISSSAVMLRRKVEMYQWQEERKTETKKKLGGGEETITTYSYQKVWSEGRIDSAGFHESGKHVNPAPVMEAKKWVAEDVALGAFALPRSLTEQMDGYESVTAPQDADFPAMVSGKNLHREEGGFYLGVTPSIPAIGDLKVTHEAVLPGAVSVISRQVRNTFEPFTAEAGGRIHMLQSGTVSADEMFTAAQRSNTSMTWVLRLVGFLMMMIGFSVVLKPLSVMADVVPLIGNVVGAGTGIVSFLLSLPITLLVISVAWIFYRPLWGVPLLVVAGLLFAVLIRKLSAARKQRMVPA